MQKKKPAYQPASLDEPQVPLEQKPNDGQELREVLIELAKRRTESLRLYEPMPVQAGFHRSMCRERIIRGGNRSGKTTAACVEVARALTGQDPFDRYPKEDGICYVVAKDERAIGSILWKKLGRAGAFKMIRDEQTGAWRMFNRALPNDLARKSQAKLAPPMIPPRMIQSISWLSKKSGVPKVLKMKNGWECHFFTSNAKPPHGTDIDLALFDEEIIGQSWYPEIAARLVDRHGYFLWSATPQAGTDQLYELHERAEKQAEWPEEKRLTEEFVIYLRDNIHLSEQQKEEFAGKLSEQERAVRIEGEFAYVSYRVFPEWSEQLHGTAYRDLPGDWTRYVSIDPGYQVCAALFAAVPPPRDGYQKGDVCFYDEIYLPRCDAMKFGAEMRKKVGQHKIRAFIIDDHEGRKHSAGDGRRVRDHYRDALKHYGVQSEVTGFDFISGDDNPKAGIEACRQAFRNRTDGTYPLKVMLERLPNFRKEIKAYRNKVIVVNGQEKVTDEPQDRGAVHLMACMRYLLQHGMVWHPPTANGSWLSSSMQAFHNIMNRKAQRESGGVMLGPKV